MARVPEEVGKEPAASLSIVARVNNGKPLLFLSWSQHTSECGPCPHPLAFVLR